MEKLQFPVPSLRGIILPGQPINQRREAGYGMTKTVVQQKSVGYVELSECQSSKQMNCLLCGHDKVHRHGKTQKGQQRYKCPCCGKTFPSHFDSLYYGRHLTQEEVHTILQAHGEGSSLRGISRISGRAYGTVVSLIQGEASKSTDDSQS